MGWRRSTVAALAAFVALPAAAQDLRLPVLVPLTGFVALEGTSQRNGALLAASQLSDVALKPDVLDTAATPEAAVTAWRNHMQHRRTQAKGRRGVFSDYRLRVACVVRDYGMKDRREQAPKDSLAVSDGA